MSSTHSSTAQRNSTRVAGICGLLLGGLLGHLSPWRPVREEPAPAPDGDRVLARRPAGGSGPRREAPVPCAPVRPDPTGWDDPFGEGAGMPLLRDVWDIEGWLDVADEIVEMTYEGDDLDELEVLAHEVLAELDFAELGLDPIATEVRCDRAPCLVVFDIKGPGCGGREEVLDIALSASLESRGQGHLLGQLGDLFWSRCDGVWVLSEVGDAEREHLREVMMVVHGQAFDEGRRHPPGEDPPVWPPEGWGVH